MVEKEGTHIQVKRRYNLMCTLTVYNQIKKGLTKKEMCSRFNLTNQQYKRSIGILNKSGYIKKVAYGTWEITEKPLKEGTHIHLERSEFKSKIVPSEKQVRSHGFGFYLKIPKISNWKNREEFLIKEKILYRKGNLTNVPSQKFNFKGFHVHLFNKGIQFVQEKETASIYSNSANLGNEIAIKGILRVVKSLERTLGTNFEINKKYELKITRQHHALIKNELANLYNKQGKKLKVFDEKGLWLIIDSSLNLDELETIHGTSASSDMDNVVKPFFNSLKEVPFTAYDFNNLFKVTENITENQKVFDANMKSHIEAVQQLGLAVKELREEIKKKNGNK